MAYGQGNYSTWFYGVDGTYVDASASISASSAVDVQGFSSVNGGAAVSSTSTTTLQNYERVVERVIPISVLAEMTPIGAINASGSATVTPSLTVTGGAIRVAQSSVQVSPALSVTDAAERVREIALGVSAEATFAASANATVVGASAIDAAVTMAAIGNKVVSTGGSTSSLAIFSASAREKWEEPADPTDIWTPLADDSVTWTELPVRAA
jgi:hypothetical protein